MEEKAFVKKNDLRVLTLRDYPLKDGGALPLFTYPLLEESKIVQHAFTTREGGVSSGEFSSLNFSFSRGDEETAVRENYRRLAEVFGADEDCIVCSDQTHTTNVLRVDKSHAGAGITKEKPYRDVDGLITDVPGLILATFYADCVPLFFVDPGHSAIGLSHSGWRGTVARMGQATLHAMHEAFGTRPKDVLAAIGPSICRDCYEVGKEVASEFVREFPAWENKILQHKGGEKYLLDLWKCNALILAEAGISEEHLAVTNICTCCNSNLLFSHRASAGRRGNLGAFLMLREM